MRFAMGGVRYKNLESHTYYRITGKTIDDELTTANNANQYTRNGVILDGDLEGLTRRTLTTNHGIQHKNFSSGELAKAGILMKSLCF